jgi:hypothetical protein
MQYIEDCQNAEVEDATAQKGAQSEVGNSDQSNGTYPGNELRQRGSDSEEYEANPDTAESCFFSDNIGILGGFCSSKQDDDKANNKLEPNEENQKFKPPVIILRYYTLFANPNNNL